MDSPAHRFLSLHPNYVHSVPASDCNTNTTPCSHSLILRMCVSLLSLFSQKGLIERTNYYVCGVFCADCYDWLTHYCVYSLTLVTQGNDQLCFTSQSGFSSTLLVNNIIIVSRSLLSPSHASSQFESTRRQVKWKSSHWLLSFDRALQVSFASFLFTL